MHNTESFGSGGGLHDTRYGSRARGHGGVAGRSWHQEERLQEAGLLHGRGRGPGHVCAPGTELHLHGAADDGHDQCDPGLLHDPDADQARAPGQCLHRRSRRALHHRQGGQPQRVHRGDRPAEPGRGLRPGRPGRGERLGTDDVRGGRRAAHAVLRDRDLGR